jgi:hypothetical protein
MTDLPPDLAAATVVVAVGDARPPAAPVHRSIRRSRRVQRDAAHPGQQVGPDSVLS